jgi:PAS domain S-box-containing protein
MITLDMKTVMFANVIVNTVCLIVMLILWYQNRNKYSGLFYWVIDWLLQAGGALLIALRGTVPNWASMLLSNSMIFGGTIILYFGLRRFIGKKNNPILVCSVLVVFAIFVAIHSYFLYVHNDLLARSYNTSIGLSLACFMCIWLIYRSVSQDIREISKGTGISLAIIILISLTRIGGFSLLPQTSNDFLKSGMFDSLFVLLLIGAIMFLVFNLVLMVNRRLYIESKLMEEKNTYLASFPEMNPSTILELDQEGNLRYLNPATKGIFPDLTTLGVKHPFLADWTQIIRELRTDNWVKPVTHEVAVGSSFYEQVICAVNENQIRIYGEDITERKQTEETLRALFQHQETILGAIPDILIEVDNNKVFTWANQAGIEFYGENVIGKEASYYFEGEQSTYRTVQPIFEGSGETIYVESWQRRQDGEKRLLAWWCRSLKDTRGNIIGALSAGQDITERKHAEEKTKESEERFRTLFESATEGILIADIETKKEKYANPAICRMLGYSQEEFTKMSLMDIHPKDSLEHVLAEFDAQARGEKNLSTLPCLKKDGTIFYADINATRVTIDGKECNVGFFTDVTERKQAKEKIRLNAMHLQNLLDLHRMADNTEKSIIDYMLEVSIGSTQSQFAFIGTISSDEAVMTIHAWSKGAMEQCAVTEKPMHFPISEAGLWGEVIRQRHPVVVNDYDASNEYKKGYPKGHVPIKRFLSIPVFSTGKIVAVAAVANKVSEYDESDVSALTSLLHEMWNLIERKRAETAMKESLAEKETLLKEVHHRVKNNMQVISSLLRLQEEKVQDKDVLAMLKDSQKRIQSMALVYNKLYQSQNLARIDMGDYIKELTLGLIKSYTTSPYRVTVNIDPSDVSLSVDMAIPCGLVINELVTNSLKYAFPENRTGQIAISLKEGSNQELALTVSDNGVGIPEGINPANTGTLGLKLVVNLVQDQLDGKIEVDRRQGTTYKITFPWSKEEK